MICNTFPPQFRWMRAGFLDLQAAQVQPAPMLCCLIRLGFLPALDDTLRDAFFSGRLSCLQAFASSNHAARQNHHIAYSKAIFPAQRKKPD